MRALLVSLVLLVATVAARAQLALPGAVSAPTPEGQSLAPPPAHHASPHKPSGSGSGSGPALRPKPPAESAILGQTLSLNGTRGALLVEKGGDGDLRVTRLILTGSKISHPNQSCEVAMGEDGPINLKPLGAPDGVTRFELQSSACPLTLDLLGGAFRASAATGACAFPQADCRADVMGLWGPSGASFSESQVKTFERERAGVEKSVQTRFRELLAKFKKKPDLAKPLIKEQADFGAARSKACRDYEKEETHGFCALRLTEARDLSLQARLADVHDAKDKKHDKDGKTVKEARKPSPRRATAPKASSKAPPPPAPGLY